MGDSEDEEDTTKSEEQQDSTPVSPPKVVSSPDPKPYKPTPSPYKEEAPVKRSPEKSDEKPVEEPQKPPAAGIALPISEMTDDWMDDGQALGSMDSEDEEASKEAVVEEKAVSDKKPEESKICGPNNTKDEKPASEAKPAGIALPTSEMTFDWMDDDTAMGSIESDEEDESTEEGKTDEEQKADVPAVASEKEVKPAGIALPITEMTDDWMDYEEEEEGPKRIEDEVVQKVETKKSEETKAPGIALPITEMTDDWMDDDVAMGSMDSEEEEEGPETDEGHVKKIVENEVIQKVETKKSEETKAPGIALPITEMTDDWMDDDVAMGSMDSE